MTERIEWEWGYYGRCFIDGKFSHGVRFSRAGDGFQGQVFDGCPEPGGLMLDTLKDCKTIDQVVDQCTVQALKVVQKGKPNLKEMKRALEEYPFKRQD